MSLFTAFMLWVFLCWLVVSLTERPLQPDRLEDDLGDVDLAERSRQVELRNTLWWESPVVNVVLSRRRGR